MLYSSDISFTKIKSIFEKQTFFADIPGYITYSFLKEKIQEKQILPKGQYLTHVQRWMQKLLYLSKDFINVNNIKNFLN